MTILTQCASHRGRINVLLKQHNFHYTVCEGYHNVSREDFHILDISENATKEEIKAAYLLKAKQLHPDNISSKDADVKKFQRLNDAYRRIIEDVQFREDYNIKESTASNFERHKARSYRTMSSRYDHEQVWNDPIFHQHRDIRVILTLTIKNVKQSE